MKASACDAALRADPGCGNGDVFVARSYFGGRGLFAQRDFCAGERLCHFRGLAASMARLERGPDDVRKKAYEYSFCDADHDLCAVPLLDLVREASLPPGLSGHLCNEASFVEALGDFAANAFVDFSAPDAFRPSRAVCPHLRGPYLQWPLLARRRVRRGEELLICYGAAYSSRNGYLPARSCA